MSIQTGKPAFTPSPQLYPFMSRWFDSSTGRIHYIDEGTGRPVLMCRQPHLELPLPQRHPPAARPLPLRRSRLPRLRIVRPPTGYGYTPFEHAAVVGELVRGLDLNDLIILGHDWGGPIGLAAAVAQPHRVTGLVLGGTWFLAPGRRSRIFSRVTSSWPLQQAILHRSNLRRAVHPARHTTPAHCRGDGSLPRRAADPDARVAVAELPRQITRASTFLAGLAEDVPRHLGHTPALITFPMRDTAFRPAQVLPRLRRALPAAAVVELHNAGHFFVEDAPEEVGEAIATHFSGRSTASSSAR